WNRFNQQYDRKGCVEVALKRLKDSQNIGPSFFQELIAHLHCESNCFVLRCYGITQDPVSKEYIMVTDYATKEVETILIALRCRSTDVIYHDEKCDSMYTGGFRHKSEEGKHYNYKIH
ncbi:8146_t:CDS:2, partial [Scutellospora calospora]